MGKKKNTKLEGEKGITYKVTIFPDYTISGKQEEKEFKSKEEVEKFLEKNAYDSKEPEVIELIENGGDYKGLNDSEFKIEIIKSEPEIEQTPFNNAELFIKEFSEYLIGKTIDFSDNEGKAGSRTKITKVFSEDGYVKINTIPVGVLTLIPSDFQNFIDGNIVGDEARDSFNLIIQEEELFNKPEYKYYVVSGDGKVLSGFEYKEDADAEKERKEKYGHDVVVEVRKELSKNIDLDNNEFWSVNEHDWNIIQSAINFGVEEKDFSESEAEKYFKGFKEKGAYVTLIKSLLLKALSMLQKQSWKAYLNSNIEKANEKNEVINRINKELVRVIEIEK